MLGDGSAFGLAGLAPSKSRNEVFVPWFTGVRDIGSNLMLSECGPSGAEGDILNVSPNDTGLSAENWS